MNDPLLLGIDLGTSSVKVLVVTAEGDVLAAGSGEYPILHPQPGFAEQEPEVWWRAVVDAVTKALKQAGNSAARRVAAIGLSGQMHGTVLLDADEVLLGNAIIWPDQRSGAQVVQVTEQLGRERLVSISGSPVATGFQAATLLWIRQQQPALFARIATVLAPKDWLRWRMTGEFAMDPSDGSGALLLDVTRRDLSPELLAAVGLRRDQLPPMRASADVAGGLTSEAGLALGLRAGTPVVVGAADTACGLLGAGAVDAHTMIVNLSTGGQLVLPAQSPAVDGLGRIHTFCTALTPGPGAAGWYQMGATLSAGMALRWLRSQVLEMQGEDAYDRLTARAAGSPLGAGGLLFLPYLVGERTPHMNPRARAAFLGLTLAHGQGEMARAVLEGATLACYDAFCVLLQVAEAPQQVVLAGGGARSALWQQIVADVFGVAVRRLLVTEQSAMGAAMLAGQGAGLLDAAQCAKRWAKWGPAVEPDAGRHTAYQQLFVFYQRAYHANNQLFGALGDFATGFAA